MGLNEPKNEALYQAFTELEIAKVTYCITELKHALYYVHSLQKKT